MITRMSAVQKIVAEVVDESARDSLLAEDVSAIEDTRTRDLWRRERDALTPHARDASSPQIGPSS